MSKCLFVFFCFFACSWGRNGWTRVTTCPEGTDISQIGIRVSINVNETLRASITSLAKDVSYPDSKQYGKYYTKESIIELLKTEDAKIDLVKSWLEKIGCTYESTIGLGTYVTATCDVEQLATQFGLQFSCFTHPNKPNNFALYRAIVSKKDADDNAETFSAFHKDLIKKLTDVLPEVSPHIRQIIGIDTLRKPLQRHDVDKVFSPILPFMGKPGYANIRSILKDEYWIDITFDILSRPLDESGQPVEITTCTVHGVGPSQTFEQVVEMVPDEKLASRFTVTMTVDLYDPIIIFLTLDYANGLRTISRSRHITVSTPMISPKSVFQSYSIPQGKIVKNPQATQSVVLLDNSYSPSDLSLFLSNYRLGEPDITVSGINENFSISDSAQSDIQWLTGMAPKAKTTVFYPKSLSDDDILSFLIDLVDMETPPLVNSMSFSMPFSLVDVVFDDEFYSQECDELFIICALRGLSMIFTSGNSGSSNAGEQTLGCSVLDPSWPAESEWVTSIGSTFFSPFSRQVCYRFFKKRVIDYIKNLFSEQESEEVIQEITENPDYAEFFDENNFEYSSSDYDWLSLINCAHAPVGEVAVSVNYGWGWTTGGGFSKRTTRPSYQDLAVSWYMTSRFAFPPLSLFNNFGRAYPDMSAAGHSLTIISDGEPVRFSGSSVSIGAGIMTLINDDLLSAGKPQLGFLNPLLYAIGEKHYKEKLSYEGLLGNDSSSPFRDIQTGSNVCSTTAVSQMCCLHGYSTAPGYDAVSGWGSPNYSKLSKAIFAYLYPDDEKK